MRTARFVPAFLVVVLVLSLFAIARPAHAALMVHRPLTLPGSSGELNLGLGLGHESGPDATGLGANFGFSWGLTSSFELSLRTGARFGRDGRATQADRYGRTFDTETYGTNGDSWANPEIGLRGSLSRGVVDLGLESRFYLPVEDGSRFGIMIALPLLIHLTGSVRLDTGLYVPIIFYDETATVVSVPLHLWLQIGGRACLGLLTGFQVYHPGGRRVPLGLGLGYSLGGSAELRTWILFPDVGGDGSARNFGAGLGLSLRF